MRPSSTLFAAAFLLFSVTAAHAQGRLVVDGAWVREAPPGASALAGYAILKNDGDAPIRVEGVSSKAFGSASIHETTEVDGVARMREMAGIDLAPGASVALEPGGRHLMLMRPVSALHDGDKVDVQFTLDNGTRLDATFPVRAAQAAAEEHSHHDHSHHDH